MHTDEAIPEGLTKLTVNITQQSRRALYASAELTEHTKTDTVNRALQLYWALQSAANEAVKLGNERGVNFCVAELQGDSFDFEVTVRFVPDAEAKRAVFVDRLLSPRWRRRLWPW